MKFKISFVENSNNPKILVAMIYSCEHLRNITSIQKKLIYECDVSGTNNKVNIVANKHMPPKR